MLWPVTSATDQRAVDPIDPTPGGNGAAQARARQADPATARVRTGYDAAAIAVVCLAALFGACERLWLLFHLPLFGDEAVVGLMARGIDAGHVTTFYWGQHYGGVEPYVAAVVGHVFSGPIGVNATAALLSAVGSVLAGLVVFEISGDRRAGMVVSALTWVWPYALVWNSSRELGFHFATLTLGLAVLYLAVRTCRGHRGAGHYLLLGLCAGAGWWSSPEIAYFLVPAGFVLVASWPRWSAGRHAPLDPKPAAMVVAGLLCGALPWLYTNLTTGFLSLSAASAPSGATTFGGRLAVFFDSVLPIELGLKTLFTGAWIGGSFWGPVFYGAGLFVILGSMASAVWVARRRKGHMLLLGCAVGVAAFPLIFAVDPGSGFWLDGRYGTDLSFLLAILGFTALAEVGGVRANGPARPTGPTGTAPPTRVHGARPSGSARRAVSAARRLVLVGVVAVAAGASLTAVASHRTSGTPDASPTAFFSGWQNPNRAMDEVAGAMRAAGIRYAYGDYWTAYDLDEVDSSLTVSPSSRDPVRSMPLAAAVAAAPRAAWLFFAPDQITEASRAFSNPEPGPGDYTEQSFLALLAERGIGSRVVHLGVLDAVLPDRRVLLP